LRPVWTPLRLSTSVLVALSGTLLLGQGPNLSTRQSVARERISQWKLAGVIPGHTTLQRAKAILGMSFLGESEYQATWTTCGKKLVIEADQWGIVKLVRVSYTQLPFDCVNAASGESKWVTGLGLGLGDSTERVTQLYGQPDSRSPSTRDAQQLEWLYFDLRGPRVTQLMKVRCSPEKEGKPERVLEITLTVRNQ
jgi:hypothetical protein